LATLYWNEEVFVVEAGTSICTTLFLGGRSLTEAETVAAGRSIA